MGRERGRGARLAVSVFVLCLCLPAATALASEGPGNSLPPVISGTPTDGLTLKAAKGTWSGAAPIHYNYQWERCDASGEACEAIPSATKTIHRATHEDVGHTLRLLVSASNDGGSTSAPSLPTSVVASAPPAHKGRPKISGVAQDGQILSAGSGIWKGTPPMTYAYRWQVCEATGAVCTDIAGANAVSYRLTSAEIGQRVKVVVTATNEGGSASETSAASKKIKPGAPVGLSAPIISGSPQEGQTLSASVGEWGGTGPLTYSYRWQRCSVLGGSCEDIGGATGPSYELGIADVASRLTVLVTASNALGSATMSSSETQPVLAILPGDLQLPTISGLLQEGQLLSVGSGSWSGSQPIGFSYQWQSCNALGQACVNISEATGPSLRLSALEVGSTLDVIVKATNSAGSSSVTTPVSGLIEGILPSNTALPTIGGVLQNGQLLSVGTGSWSGTQPISYSYQWQLCNALSKACTNIAEATGPTLKLSLGDVGGLLDVVVKATNAAGSSSVTTGLTGLIGI